MATSTGHELVVATEACGQQWSAAAWDLQTGNSVRTFKGQPVEPGCLCLRSGHSLIGAAASKPFLQIWPLCKQDETQQKIICPGTVQVLAVSPDGLFCVASIGEKIYIWEMTAGSLLGLLSSHDDVKKIQFTDDGSHFVVGTGSGLLQIWNFAHVVSAAGQGAKGARCLRTVSAHPEAITDIHVGCGGPAARVATASSDGTCKLWDMMSGELIRTMVYESSVQSVIMDKREHFLIAGLVTGLVLCSPLYGQISQTEVFVSKHATKAGEFVLQAHTKGHAGAVKCLALSSDDSYLAAGSDDGTLTIWNLEQGGTVISRCLAGPVGNVMIVPPIIPGSVPMYSGPSISFKQHIAREDQGRGRVFNVTISDTSQLPVPDFSADIAQMLRLSSSVEQEKEGSEESMAEKIVSLEREIAHLKQVRKDLTSDVLKKTVEIQR